MNDMHKIVYKAGTGELLIKKSRFIASIVPIHTEEEAISFIAATKKKYWDASHNCTAYVLGINHGIQRFSDDGEPMGTAGKPMLDVLISEGIHNTAVVVTRYFGGKLLGTGGLIRAYQGAVSEGLKNCQIMTRKRGVKICIKTDYHLISKIRHISEQMGVTELDCNFTDIVTLLVVLPEELTKSFKNKIAEATSAKAEIIIGDSEWLYEPFLLNTE